MLQDVIISLLKNNSRVIIPDLGAFIIKPGSESVSFNEFVKFNDGLLAESLMNSKGMDKSEASKEVKKFSHYIVKCISKDKECDLSPLGILYLDENDKIQIKSSISIGQPTGDTKIAENKEFRNETQALHETYNPPVNSSLQDKAKVEVSNTSLPKETNTMENKMNSSKSEFSETQSGIDYYPPKGRSLKKVFFISFLLLSIVAVVLYFAFVENSNFLGKADKNSTRQESLKDASQKPSSEPAIIPETTSNKSDASSFSGSQGLVVAKRDPGKSFHIIAGAFVIEKNASAFMKDLVTKGYAPQVVLKRSEYNFIAIYSFPTYNEAKSKLKNIQSTGMPVWIMKY